MPGFATPRRLHKPERPGWRPGQPVQHDYYPTPSDAVASLLTAEIFDGPIWEPACGSGSISHVLRRYEYPVVSTDLYEYGFGESGVDFLTQAQPRAKHIVTNPPYGKGLADRFVEHALRLTAETGGKVAMLLNLASLCHPLRTAWWRKHPPVRIYAIDDCSCWDTLAFGPAPWRENTQRYMWAIWEHGQNSGTELKWLSVRSLGIPPRRYQG